MGGLLLAAAPTTSDAIAFFEIGIAGLLLAGMFIVRAGHVRVHMYLQSLMVLVNIPVVLAWMLPQYLAHVLPDLGSELAKPYYLLPTIALFAGSAAEILGIYILLVAGTGLVPERYRFRRYKLWMRTELGLWWTVVVIGLLTYYVWYAAVAPAPSGYSGY
jgi:uncharacterized membrane protein YozB (DUF420 family)